MEQKFDLSRNVYIDVDPHGTVRQLLHTHAPVRLDAPTPQLAASKYLAEFRDLLGLTPDELKSLSLAPSDHLENTAIEYRFTKEKHQFDGATVAFYQTDFGIPVWEAGLAVQIKLNPLRVLSSQSTRHPDLKVKRPSADKVKKALALSEGELSRLLGFASKQRNGFDSASLKIEGRRLFIYRYERAKRGAMAERADISIDAKQRKSPLIPGPPTLPLPPVPSPIREGEHYVCVRIDFSLAMNQRRLLHWVALIEVETLSVLYLRAFTDNVNGMVFESDPVTSNAGPLPTANSASLNPVRVSKTLPGLSAPVGGTQSLTGVNVQLSDGEAPTVAVPTEPSGTDFDFDARTNNFAGVNAYYHCDKFFRLLDGMGFTKAGYFGGTTFPASVDHRGNYGTADGIEVNAHCDGNAGGNGIGLTGFCLADLGDTANPIGISADYRVVLHELGGHGVLYNHVGSANLGFSHSAGDGIAAILNDPGTQAPDRFQTFPWVYNTVNRRHDRTVAAGWGWGGTNDTNGYSTEQILATTHFRIYRSIGGDSGDLAMQQFASRMAVYLILRAIGTLTPATNPANVTAWVTALLTADVGDWTTENITGGAYSKVIRWAFEKQGLYQPAGAPTPTTSEGAPPAIDVYIDDGRAGEYQYQPNWWSCQSIWNRLANDGGTTHQEPVTNQTNYAYVKIKNRGSQNATGVVVKAFHANPAAGLSYPIDWFAMNTSQLAAPDVPANNATEITVGPFEWIPTHVGHECIFMIVSATGDPSNVNQIAAGDSIPEWRLVSNDNNIGQRNVFPVSGGGTSGLTSDFNRFSFEVKNPHGKPATVEVRTVLPSFLNFRGWKLEFKNRGGASFTLEPGASRDVKIRLVPGEDFTPADVAASPDKTIHLYGYADGILVGGMSYEVDPNLKAPGRHHQKEGQCASIAEELVKCLDLTRHKVRRARIRKINVDLEIEESDDCCD